MLPSPKQHALLTYIDGFIKENSYAPSYREVMRALDYKSVSTVAKHIEGLIERGWLIKRDNSARSVEVVYKAGETQPAESPAPSELEHEKWLQRLIDSRITDISLAMDKATRAELVSALRTLGLDGLAARYDTNNK